MNKLFPLAFVVFLIAISTAYAFTKGTSNFYVNYQIAEPITLNDGTVIEYTPVCLADCYLPIEFYYSGTLAPTSKTLQISDLGWIKKKILGSDNLNSVQFRYIANKTYDYQEWIPNVKCYPYSICEDPYNTSCIIGNCTDSGYYVTKTGWNYQMLPIPASITLQKDKHYTIVIIGHKNPSTAFSAVDIAPSIFSYSMDELAWFNTSFPKCKNITVTSPATNYTSVINVSYDSDMLANFSDLRYADAPCNNGGSELSHFKRTYVASSWISEDLKLDGTQPVISVYYGNPSASSTSSITNVWGTDVLVYVTLDEGTGTNIINLANLANNGTLYGSAYGWHNSSEGVCRKQGCLSFSAAGTDYIAFTSQLALNGYSVQQWINATGTGTTEECSFSWENYPSSPRVMNLYSHNRGSNKNYYWELQVAGTGGSASNVSNLLEWTTQASVRSGTTIYAYKNSTQIGGAITVGAGSLTTTALTLGCHYYSAACNEKYNGVMDDTLIWNRSLSTTEIANLYAAVEPTFAFGSEETYGAGTTPTSMREWLNSAESSLTLGYGYSNLNITALINVSGLPVSILRNNTILTTAITRAENTSNGLGAGYYNFTSNFSGNATYDSSSQSYFLTVSPSPTGCSLTYSPSSPIDYETQMKAICSCNNSIGTTTLYRNGTNITAQNNTYVVLPAQGYVFICNLTSSQNYSSATNTSNYIINKKDANIQAKPDSAFTYIEGTTNQYCTGSSSLSCSIFRNGTSVSNSTGFNFPIGIWTMFSNITDKTNYTNWNDTHSINVSQANPDLTITFNVSSPAVIGSIINVTCSGISTQILLTNSLHNDTALTTNPYIWNTAGRAAGTYNFSCDYTGSQNYTAGTATNQSMVLATTGSLYIVAYDEKTNASLTFNISIYNATFTDTQYNLASYSSSSVSGDVTVVISKNGYIQRNYYLNIPVAGTTTLTAYLLDYSSGVYPTFWIYSASNPLGEFAAKINVYRFLGSGYVLVAQQLSDVEGKGILYLDPYTTYVVNAENSDGSLTYNLSSYQANSAFILRINLGGGAAGTNITWLFTNTTYSLFSTDIYLRPNNVSNITLINYTVLSGLSDISWYALRLIYWNGTILYSGNGTSSSGGSLSVNLNYNSLNGTIIAQTFLKKTGFDLFQFNRTYIVWRSSSAIPDILNEVKNAGFSNVIQSLIALFVSYCIALIINRAWRTGTGIVFLGVMTGFTLYGWFNFTFILGLWMMEIGILLYREVY